MQNTLLFCTGPSGSGKSYFIKNTLPDGLFYNLKSATTRDMRPGESDGCEYYFRDEEYFLTTPLATKLWVNRDFWQPGQKKWLYGVPETEIIQNLGKNFIYDVIEPKYIRQMINWFRMHGLETIYSFKVAWFLPAKNNMDILSARANMPNDLDVRQKNTCDANDFLDVGIWHDYILCPIKNQMDSRLMQYIGMLYDEMLWRQSKGQEPVISK